MIRTCLGDNWEALLILLLFWEHAMSRATLYKWRAKYSGMDASLISKMKARRRALLVT